MALIKLYVAPENRSAYLVQYGTYGIDLVQTCCTMGGILGVIRCWKQFSDETRSSETSKPAVFWREEL